MNQKKSRSPQKNKSYNFLAWLKDNSKSFTQLLVLFGSGSLIIGILVYIFFRDIQDAGIIVSGIAIITLLIAAILNRKNVFRSILGRRGKYSANTFFIVFGTILLMISANILFFWLETKNSPPGWIRTDLTATKEYELSEQSGAVLDQLTEDIEIFIFIKNNTQNSNLAIRRTEDLLSEFSKRSTTKNLTYKLIDPDLDPDIAQKLGIDRFLAGRNLPSLAFKGSETQRISYSIGIDPRENPDVFSEQDIITGLLVVSQLKQKIVLFLSGHDERDITDFDQNSNGYGLAVNALVRDNYIVNNATIAELGSILASGDPENFPAAVIIADPKEPITQPQSQLLTEYINYGGNIFILIESDVPEEYLTFLSQWGIMVGDGTLIDTISYVAPNLDFLQVKNTNLQIPDHPITHNFDVMYFPGASYIGMSLSQEEMPITPEGVLYVNSQPLAFTTINSWSETNLEELAFDNKVDTPGPLPIAMASQVISTVISEPLEQIDGGYLYSHLVVIGDSDFASNKYITSSRNQDFFANSVNWLTKDSELISIRVKESVFRELVLTKNERAFIRWSGWLLMPSVIGSLGILAWWRRR
ncbi:MAG: hypothetical protein CL764_00245 [Chloroflexi bacterium]|nr:hypothetical protein [Chloroflexota bacterium]|tara:strand:+ start:8555 stop:10312 length:1758 start_codon:yes stop_codon:yes gene_type:complete